MRKDRRLCSYNVVIGGFSIFFALTKPEPRLLGQNDFNYFMIHRGEPWRNTAKNAGSFVPDYRNSATGQAKERIVLI
jgi:hypothetical protein